MAQAAAGRAKEAADAQRAQAAAAAAAAAAAPPNVSKKPTEAHGAEADAKPPLRIIFIKSFKVASTTVSAILQRIAEERNMKVSTCTACGVARTHASPLQSRRQSQLHPPSGLLSTHTAVRLPIDTTPFK